MSKSRHVEGAAQCSETLRPVQGAERPNPDILKETTGDRFLVRCCLPNINHFQNAGTLTALNTELCARFGGFTSYHMTGGWKDDTGHIHIETGLVYEITMYPTTLKNTIEVRDVFLKWGKVIGEIDIHIEIHKISVTHATVNLTPQQKIDKELQDALARRTAANRPWGE